MSEPAESAVSILTVKYMTYVIRQHKAYEFMKQFVIDGVNLLERFLESVGKIFTHINDQIR